ncbi:MAG: FAD-dependent oxidoreductase [Gammaproteobacteria bacterium]|nr:FAD-dependent oxidoreductase [Gammaproteobacteria bacterium]
MKVDICIIGGGIAGLWTLNRLRQQGYQTILIENADLGGDQTCASQGIIHGGTKYALTGTVTGSAKAISEMPKRWLSCLKGDGEIDLNQVEILAPHQFLWTENDIATRLTGFFASKLMQSKMVAIKSDQQADFFHQQYRNSQFNGHVYQLNEPVINTQQLINKLFNNYKQSVIKATISDIKRTSDNDYQLYFDGDVNIQTKQLILTAGNGNQALYHKIFSDSNAKHSMQVMQQRPLQMLMLKGKNLKPIYAHRLGVSALPTITISSHKIPELDETIWYIGGELAEKFATKSQYELIIAAKEQLSKFIPWQNFENIDWSSLYVNRAEPLMDKGQRPDNQFMAVKDNIILAWPVKLALTPLLADDICNLLEQSRLIAKNKPLPIEFENFIKPGLCKMPWEKTKQWSQ